jgi:hypothetical protein
MQHFILRFIKMSFFLCGSRRKRGAGGGDRRPKDKGEEGFTLQITLLSLFISTRVPRELCNNTVSRYLFF